MGILDDLQSVVSTRFSGPNMLVNEEDVTGPAGLYAKDVEYLPGQARTRRGFAQVWNPNRIITAFYNWIQQSFNRLVYLHSGTTVVSRDLYASTEQTIITGLSALGMICAQAGPRIFMSFFNADGTTNSPTGATEGRVWDGTLTSGTPNVEKLYPRPLMASEVTVTITEPGAGVVSPGKHYIGFIVTSYNGGVTPPGPADASLNFSYLTTGCPSFTASGSKNCNVNIAPVGTWPLWVNTIQLIMVPVQNPDQWYIIPGATASVARGSALAINILFNLSDTTLALGTNVTDEGYFSLLTQSSTNNGPFSPFGLISYNNRLVALAQDLGPDGFSSVGTIFASNPNQPQWISRAYHQLFLPEFRQVSAGFVLGNSLFVCGPSHIYAFSDNSQFPVLWAPPRKVSTSVGTRFPRGVLYNTTRGYAWIADSSGLYYFQGQNLPDLPASYWQTPDWLLINFSAPPDTLVVDEDPNRRLIFVKAPVGAGQQTANRILVWDYSEGVSPNKIKYCGMWSIKQGAYLIGALGQVYSPGNKNSEVWIGRAGATGNVLRQMYYPADGTSALDPAIYTDDGTGIDSHYRHGPMFGVSDGPDQHIAVNFRMLGSGSMNITAYSLDQTNPASLSPATLTASPAKRFFRWVNKQSEAISYEIDNGGVSGAFFVLAAIKSWRKKWLDFRG